MNGIVIVGGGQAGHQLAVSLRAEGYDRPITIVEAEPQLPYQRPPLSKDFLTANDGTLDLAFVELGQYAEDRIEVLAGVRVALIDRAHREVVLDSGRRLAYDQLVLATGARARRPGVRGSTLDGVHTLRSLADAQRLRTKLSHVANVVVVGGGFIGLEFASSAAQIGSRVIVLESGPRILRRSVSTHAAEFLTSEHIAHGVAIETHAVPTEFLGRNVNVTGVRLEGGSTLAADLVVVGIGVEPNVELATDAGLEVDQGVVVDEQLRSSDDRIYAIGDVAWFKSDFAPGRGRVESVQNAVDQARCLARTLTGVPTGYHDLPWFWSQQAGHRLQIAGISTAADAVRLRPTEDPSKFSVFCYRADRLVAIESVDQPRIHMQARRLLAARISIPIERVAEPELDLAAELEAHEGLLAR
ncbi:MAG TPA: FAD-dependent oxidoreductase [Galbitalea sp.]|jgi:3-phenylpropionate/trans-cinnamate dioxygenase ferredoxin reductase subunit|nr:FAD-dependent oxidoreductase [Galbitalea sp.]